MLGIFCLAPMMVISIEIADTSAPPGMTHTGLLINGPNTIGETPSQMSVGRRSESSRDEGLTVELTKSLGSSRLRGHGSSRMGNIVRVDAMMDKLVVRSYECDKGGVKCRRAAKEKIHWLETAQPCCPLAHFIISPTHPHIGYCFNVHRFHETVSITVTNASHIQRRGRHGARA